jgi:cell wall-associated NlpC family hydrolase
VNEGSIRRAFTKPLLDQRGVMRAALAVFLLSLSIAAIIPTAKARAQTVARAAQATTSLATREYRLRMSAWRYAVSQHYKPYIWGGTGPAGFDCSGLVYAAYRQAGITLPRTTYEMLGSWRLVRIPKSLARRGDLAFFGSGHVEVYDWGPWTFGATTEGTRIGFHRMNAFWHPTMYFMVKL